MLTSTQVMRVPRLAALAVSLAACSASAPAPEHPTPIAAQAQPAAAPVLRDPREVRLADVRQLTFGGENAEAYWSSDGKKLIFQSTRPPYACDQIFEMSVDAPEPH